jgi:tRNA pseudouridine38-40 synthase
MSERNIRLVLAYDGTDFAGWQKQREGRTVQSVLEVGLERMHGHAVRVVAAGRTDAGVHARGQVANFFSDIDSIPGRRFRDAINSYIPRDVRVISSTVADERFHARYHALARTYTYNIYCGSVPFPHSGRYSLHVRRHLDLETLNRFVSIVSGEHDFSTFAGSRDINDSKVRIVYSSSFYPAGDFLVYRISADSFLYRMVRSIVGTILDHIANGKNEAEFGEALSSRSRKNAGPTAPAKGLFLDRVSYAGDRDFPLFRHWESGERI